MMGKRLCMSEHFLTHIGSAPIPVLSYRYGQKEVIV